MTDGLLAKAAAMAQRYRISKEDDRGELTAECGLGAWARLSDPSREDDTLIFGGVTFRSSKTVDRDKIVLKLRGETFSEIDTA